MLADALLICNYGHRSSDELRGLIFAERRIIAQALCWYLQVSTKKYVHEVAEVPVTINVCHGRS